MGRRWNWQSSRELKDELSRRGIRLFSHQSIRLASLDFTTLIGEGGFAKVYRGVLHDGIPVAIKVLKSDLHGSKQSFVEMIDLFSHIQHTNLNRVIGCCVDEGARIVVSDYIDNGTLSDLIGDSDRRSSIFSWEKRVALCIGIARGISYLHHDIHPKLIHRDINPSNILLDSNLTPKIIDFEWVDFVYKDQDLPLEDRVVGTMGFLDPEYMKTGKYTEKADVYAFGVVLLEVVSGRRAIQLGSDYYNGFSWIGRWAAKLVADGRKLEVVDSLLTDFPKDEALHFIDVAFLCIQGKSERRPSMSDVLLMLSCASVDATLIQDYLSVVTSIYVEDDGEYNSYTFSTVTSTFVENDWENKAQTVSANAHVDSSSKVIDRGELDEDSAENEQIEPCTSRAQGGQDRTQGKSNGATVLRLFPRNTKNNTNKNVCPEAVYPPFRTMVFTHNTTTTTNNNSNVFPEAIYPPFRTRVFRRLGSRNLYAWEPRRALSQVDISTRVSQTAVFTNRSRHVFPEAVYPPFHTGAFRQQGSRDLYTFSTMHSVS